MKNNLKTFDIPKDLLQKWQEILNITASLLDLPAALIMRLEDPDIAVLVASQNEDNPYTPGDKEHFWDSGLYCETVIRNNRKLLVPDALADEDWKDNPDVKLNMISYLGYPLVLPDEKPFGTICVLDRKPKEYSETEQNLLLKFRDLIESHLHLAYVNSVLGDENKKLSDYLGEIQAFRGMTTICSNCKAIKNDHGHWEPLEKYLISHPDADFSHGICTDCMTKLYPNVRRDQR